MTSYRPDHHFRFLLGTYFLFIDVGGGIDASSVYIAEEVFIHVRV